MNKNHLYLLIIAGLIGVLGWQVWSISTRDETTGSSANAKQVVMYKNPGCQCCSRWAARMEQAGFQVSEKPTNRLASIKQEKGVPYQMSACHTALVGGYVVEGHVPTQDVKRLLSKRPDALGLAVPGMPQGSPGMETGREEPYTVYLMGKDGSKSVFAKH